MTMDVHYSSSKMDYDKSMGYNSNAEVSGRNGEVNNERD